MDYLNPLAGSPMGNPLQPFTHNALAMIPGMLTPGNINVFNRPRVRNPDGSISTVRSMSVNFGGPEVLIPTVSDDGRIMTPQEAISTFQKTGRHLGMFATPEAATTYAQSLHEQQGRQYADR